MRGQELRFSEAASIHGDLRRNQGYRQVGNCPQGLEKMARPARLELATLCLEVKVKTLKGLL